MPKVSSTKEHLIHCPTNGGRGISLVRERRNLGEMSIISIWRSGYILDNDILLNYTSHTFL